MWLRHNALRGELADGIAMLEADGLKVTTNPFAPQALAVDPPRPVQDIPGFLDGRFSVQDAAAQLAAQLLDPRGDMRLLDACAAPGGKTGHLLEIAPQARLLALDLTDGRVALIRDNLQRLKLEATLKKADAAEPSQWWDGTPFDAVLLDAPCSATGVIRRHPDIKWLRTAQQVEQVCLTQQRLLRRLWPLVAPGGILVYATCSVLQCENSEQIQTFLHDNSDANCVGPDAGFGHAQDFGRQILPGEHAMDGFYYAVLRKSA
jgi:16S rRNA (cytosine967-C5)-methyltransferase